MNLENKCKDINNNVVKLKQSLLLYAVTDRSFLKGRNLYSAVESALIGGVTMIQLREKQCGEEEFLLEAVEISKITKKYGVPLIINDNVKIALEIGADGVHLGQNDISIRKARAILGNKAIIGQTAKTVEQALVAEKNGADYLGVGAAFPTSTKTDTWVISHNVYREISAAVKIPIVAIGGINENNALSLCKTGISGIAAVSSIFGQNDIEGAARRLKGIAQKVVL